ncbi:Protein of unknown function [Bacillus wiedmannii]|uniref:ABC transporter permease n=1 Tax=Bacillus wiedmannii TaxID=1890302 RepID=A0AB37YQX5_9BACI|nr:Protein of unknown function [Bacillus wiedmannii]
MTLVGLLNKKGMHISLLQKLNLMAILAALLLILSMVQVGKLTKLKTI